MTTRKPTKAPPPFINVKLPRPLWARVCAEAESRSPRVTGAALLEHLVTQALEAEAPRGEP